jgi:hypothetical protein
MEFKIFLTVIFFGEFVLSWFLIKHSSKLKKELKEAKEELNRQEQLLDDFSKSEKKADKNKKNVSQSAGNDRLANSLNILRNNKKDKE